MDIGSGKRYPASALSNFARHPFVFDGVECASMEGFLQSLKFENKEMQKHVCTLHGIAAKRKGQKKRWWVKQTLYWQGQEYKRESKEYYDLLFRAYHVCAEQNTGFRAALLATYKATLKHSIGKKEKTKTVLTEQEFCGILTKVRTYWQNRNWESRNKI